MTELLEKTAKALEGYSGKKLAIGVSGGRDSMCLLHAVMSCGVAAREDIIAVHVNHLLRSTAERDENFVREFCKKNDIKLKVVRVDVRREAKERGLTIEQAARDMRYGIFYDMLKSGEADAILTAHHALDNAESVLMHIFRGSGLDGLRGMTDKKVLRPFIDVYPDELDGYYQENDIEYMTDETNLDDDADRNYIRLRVLPLIEKRYAGAVRAINALAKECGDISEYLEGEIDEKYIRFDHGAVTVSDEALKGPLASRYVRRALKHFTLTDMTRAQIDGVTALVDMDTGSIAELSHGVKAAREYGCVAIYIPRDGYGGESEIKLGVNFIDGLAVDITEEDADVKKLKGGVADFDALAGATLRFRRDGDTFTPYGGRSKKLKQYLIDKKIPARLRDRIPLICRGDEALVVVGVEISDKVKRTEGTKHTVAIRQRW